MRFILIFHIDTDTRMARHVLQARTCPTTHESTHEDAIDNQVNYKYCVSPSSVSHAEPYTGHEDARTAVIQEDAASGN